MNSSLVFINVFLIRAFVQTINQLISKQHLKKFSPLELLINSVMTQRLEAKMEEYASFMSFHESPRNL